MGVQGQKSLGIPRGLYAGLDFYDAEICPTGITICFLVSGVQIGVLCCGRSAKSASVAVDYFTSTAVVLLLS